MELKLGGKNTIFQIPHPIIFIRKDSTNPESPSETCRDPSLADSPSLPFLPYFLVSIFLSIFHYLSLSSSIIIIHFFLFIFHHLFLSILISHHYFFTAAVSAAVPLAVSDVKGSFFQVSAPSGAPTSTGVIRCHRLRSPSTHSVGHPPLRSEMAQSQQRLQFFVSMTSLRDVIDPCLSGLARDVTA